MTEAPRRVQLSRAKGWRMPPNTVKVSRPGPYGNPFSIAEAMEREGLPHFECRPIVVRHFRDWITNPTSDDPCHESGFGGRLQAHTRIREGLPALRGRNLACWCPIDQPCHADVLLELANPTTPTPEPTP